MTTILPHCCRALSAADLRDLTLSLDAALGGARSLAEAIAELSSTPAMAPDRRIEAISAVVTPMLKELAAASAASDQLFCFHRMAGETA